MKYTERTSKQKENKKQRKTPPKPEDRRTPQIPLRKPKPTKRPRLHYNRTSPLAFHPVRTNSPRIEVDRTYLNPNGKSK
jgi:hypothetical protein